MPPIVTTDCVFPLVTIDCHRVIEGATTLDDITIVKEDYPECDTTYYCNAYCCGELYETPQAAERAVKDLDCARSMVLEASVKAALERLGDEQADELLNLRERHESQTRALKDQLAAFVDKLDPNQYFLDWKMRRDLGISR